MQRLVLRIITGLVAFILGLLAWMVSFGFSTSPTPELRFDNQEQQHRTHARRAKDSGCSYHRR